MRAGRRGLILAIWVCLASVTLAQSGGGKFSPRIGNQDRVPLANENPTVTVVAPTSADMMETSALSIQACVTALDTDGDGIATVTWTNSAGGSGVALPSGQPNHYCVAQGVEDTILMSDDFSSTANVDLVTLTPPVGMAWSTFVATSSNYCQNMAVGNVRPGIGQANTLLMCEGTPAQALSGTDYTIGFSIGASGIGGDGDAKGPWFGGVDASNWCGLAIYYGAQTGTDDVRLFSWVAGVRANIATVDVGPSSLDTFTLVKAGTSLIVNRNGSQILSTTSSVCGGSRFGMFFGAGPSAGDDASQSTNLDDFTLTDNGDTSVGIVLQTGLNTLTFTATDGDGNMGSDTLAVTRTATDDIDPVIQFTDPTSGANHSTGNVTLDFAGSTSDNVGTVNVTWTCATCTPTSGTATRTAGTAAAWTGWAITNVVTVSGNNTLIVTATDAASRTKVAQLVIAVNTSDITDPSITMTLPATDPYTSPTQTVALSGTVSDNSALATPAVICVNSLGGSVNATGTTTWNATVPLFNSTMNVITCTARDANNNTAFVDVTVTYVQALSISTLSPLPTGMDTVAYGPGGMGVTLSAAGGSGTYTWTQTVALSSDADCAGLSFADVGATALVSGTPTAPMATALTCTFTAQVADGVATPVQRMYTITLNPFGAEGPHDYFTALLADPKCHRAVSLRPVSGQTTSYKALADTAACAGAYHQGQLERSSLGGLSTGNCETDANRIAAGLPTCRQFITYAPIDGADSDPEAQDAAKSVIPPFTTADNASHPINGPVVAAPGITDTTSLVFNIKRWDNGLADCNQFTAKSIKIDDEIMKISSVGGCNETAQTMTVQARGMYGSTPATHAVGTRMYWSANNHPRNLRYSMGTTIGGSTAVGHALPEDFDYFVVMDTYHTESYRQSGLGNNKFFNYNIVGDTGIWFEPNTSLRAEQGNAAVSCGIANPAGPTETYVYGAGARTYNTLQSKYTPPINTSDWSLTDSVAAGPNVLTENFIPLDGIQCVKFSEWARWFVRMKVRSPAQGGWEIVSMWVATESSPAVLVLNEELISIPTYRTGITNHHFQFGTSTDDLVRGTVGGTPNGLRDLVMYLRNFVMLKAPMADNYFSGATLTALLKQPVR